MKRLMTSTCLAAAFAVGLAAQTAGTSGTAQDPPAGGQGRGGPRPVTATGCLRAGDTAGTYMLTDVQMQGGGGRRGGDTGAGSGSTPGTPAQGGRGNMPTTVMLNAGSDVDLKPHVGHKIEVTGTMMGGRGRGAGGGDTGAGSGTGTAASGGGRQGRGGMRNVTVTSVRMISESCS